MSAAVAESRPATAAGDGARRTLRRVAIPVLDSSQLFDVEVEDGHFASIRAVGETAAGAKPAASLWPGYTECHAHIALPANFDDSIDEPELVALQYLYHGVTQVVDMFGFPLVRQRWQDAAAASWLPYPEVAHCGYAITAMCGYDGKGAHGTEFPSPVFMLGCESDLDTILEANAKLGASFLKVMFTDGVEQPGSPVKFNRLSAPLLEALAKAVAARGIPCVLDCNTREEVLLAYRFGFRYFAHAVRDVELSDADWANLPGASFVSTLSGLRPMVMSREEFLDEYGHAGFVQTQDAANLDFVAGIEQPFGVARNCFETRTGALRAMRQNSRAALARGALRVGTDAGNAGGFHGYSLLAELRLLAERRGRADIALQTNACLDGRRFFELLAGRAASEPFAVGAAATFNLFRDADAATGALPDETVVRGIAVDRARIAQFIHSRRASATKGKVSL
ncbi:hypothetical protein [Chromobacterium subtsugae]|uniref:hypothetical protein n=1 Tax=Chromobacterium subtsugae TaxID=251747 RepID=UPI0006415FAE|nr:hypothetical protein [Chromobacterium subtsugae]